MINFVVLPRNYKYIKDEENYIGISFYHSFYIPLCASSSF